MKGYTYQEETARQVGLEAMKHGITGEGGSAVGGLGELAGLGVGLGAMSGVIGMTKEAMSPILDSAGQIGQNVTAPILGGTWDCACGQKGLTGKFCPECGTPRPAPAQDGPWDCVCGQKGLTGKFCPECGRKKGDVQ